MNILINFGTLKDGGGQNVALNFMASLLTIQNNNYYHFIIVKDTQLHKFFINSKINNYTLVPKNPIGRILYELVLGRFIVYKYKINIIYSYFGIGLYPKYIPQVTGSADSNIYFPEIDFWSQYSGINLFFKKIIDNYRIWGLKRASGIIFENKELERRCHKLFKLRETRFIKPSISNYENNKKNIFKDKFNNDTPKGLFLCSWQLNKNIMMIPEIAKLIKDQGIDFSFILTAPIDSSSMHIQFSNLIKKNDVGNMVNIIGQVKKEDLSNLYNQIDYVFLLSKLESFSNNIIESWFFKKPLIISDEPWAKSICKDGAIYVNRKSPSDIVEKIINICNNPNYKSRILLNTKNILKTYPSIDQRTKQELDYLNYIYGKN